MIEHLSDRNTVKVITSATIPSPSVPVITSTADPESKAQRLNEPLLPQITVDAVAANAAAAAALPSDTTSIVAAKPASIPTRTWGDTTFTLGAYTASFVGNMFTTTPAILDMFWHHFMNLPGDTFMENITSGDASSVTIFLRAIGPGLVVVCAVNGIIWLNVSGAETNRDKIRRMFASDISSTERAKRITNVVGTAIGIIPSGVAMAALSRLNTTYLFGAETVASMPWIEQAAVYGNLVIVGSGVSNFLVGQAISIYNNYAPAWIYGQERRLFRNMLGRITDFINLRADNSTASKLMSYLSKITDFSTLLKNPTELTKFVRELPILDQAHPTVKSHPATSLLCLAAAAALSYPGVKSLYDLIKIGLSSFAYPAFPSWLLETLAQTGLYANLLLWTASAYPATQSILRNLPHPIDLLDSSNQQTCKGLGLLVLANFFSASFGSSMGAIPILDHTEATPLWGIDGYGTQALSSFSVNWLICMLAIMAIWKFRNGWILKTDFDNIMGQLQNMTSAFDSLSQTEQMNALRTIDAALAPIPRQGAAAAAAGAAGPTQQLPPPPQADGTVQTETVRDTMLGDCSSLFRSAPEDIGKKGCLARVCGCLFSCKPTPTRTDEPRYLRLTDNLDAAGPPAAAAAGRPA